MPKLNELRDQMRTEPCLDRRYPLGIPASNGRPEVGPTAGEYYRRKHGPRGPGPGHYWPLHVTTGGGKQTG